MRSRYRISVSLIAASGALLGPTMLTPAIAAEICVAVGPRLVDCEVTASGPATLTIQATQWSYTVRGPDGALRGGGSGAGLSYLVEPKITQIPTSVGDTITLTIDGAGHGSVYA